MQPWYLFAFENRFPKQKRWPFRCFSHKDKHKTSQLRLEKTINQFLLFISLILGQSLALTPYLKVLSSPCFRPWLNPKDLHTAPSLIPEQSHSPFWQRHYLSAGKNITLKFQEWIWMFKLTKSEKCRLSKSVSSTIRHGYNSLVSNITEYIT